MFRQKLKFFDHPHKCQDWSTQNLQRDTNARVPTVHEESHVCKAMPMLQVKEVVFSRV